MKIIGCCIYYDESPAWLTASLASLAPVVDVFIYIDGAYVLYPGATDKPASNVDCAVALHETAAACHKTLLHYRASEPFYGNEVEKRQLYVDLANSLPGSSHDDWVLVFDADNIARKSTPFLREDLTRTELLVAEYGVYQDTDPQAKLDDGDTSVLLNQSENRTLVRGLYRNIPDLGYGPAHWIVSGTDPDSGAFGYLWGNPTVHQPIAAALDVSSSLSFDHRRHKRLPERDLSARKYYLARDTARVEALGKQLVKNVSGEYSAV